MDSGWKDRAIDVALAIAEDTDESTDDRLAAVQLLLSAAERDKAAAIEDKRLSTKAVS